MNRPHAEVDPTPQRPQVRVALSRWTNADGGKWVTTGPPIAAGRSYAFDGQLGYLMTAASNQTASIKLDECFSARSGNGFLAEAGRCVAEGTERRRVAGYAFRSEQPRTIAIYSCLSRDYARFTSSRADCDNAGTRDRVLGFVIR